MDSAAHQRFAQRGLAGRKNTRYAPLCLRDFDALVRLSLLSTAGGISVDARPSKAVSSTGRGCLVDILPQKSLSSTTEASLWIRGRQKLFHPPGGVFGGYSPAKTAFIHRRGLPVDARRAPDAIHSKNTPISGTEQLAGGVCPGNPLFSGTRLAKQKAGAECRSPPRCPAAETTPTPAAPCAFFIL